MAHQQTSTCDTVKLTYLADVYEVLKASEKCLPGGQLENNTQPSGHQIVGPVGPVGHLHLWSDSDGILNMKDQMSDRSLESPFYIFGHKIILIAPTEKYNIPTDLSDRVEYDFEIKSIITLDILSGN